MLKRYLAIGLVAIMSLGILAACGSTDDDADGSVASPAQSANAPAVATATAQSELADTWTPTPEPEVAEEDEATDDAATDDAAADDAATDDAATDDAATDDTATDDAATDDAATDDTAAGSSGTVDLNVSAVDIAYEETELEGPADTDFTITVTNNGAADHDFVIEDTDFRTEILGAGETQTITVNLPAGEYTYYCSVPGHRQAGMEGTLIISEGGGMTVVPAEEDAGSDEAAGDGGADEAAGEPVELQVTAIDIDFVESELEAPAGTDFTITLTNNGAIQHDFVIEGTDFRTSLLNGGQTETITVNLPAGEYVYYCSVPGHRQAGMEGILTITESGAASVAPAEEEADAAASTPDDAEAAGGEPVELQVSAVDIAYEQTEYEGPADTDFTITLTNNGAADHDFVIEDTDFRTEILGAGESQTITVNLPAGEYTFYCSVPGHRQVGMEGTLIISEDGGATVETDAGGDAAAGEAVELDVSAVDIAYEQTEYNAPADTEFTITVTNNGAADHDFVIEGTDFRTQILRAGQSETITVTLPAGEYTFFCSVPGHRQAGMEGTLKVG
jgi:uncharacterized cupredoxin-like copper-binding protein